jgi:hypothetical protein
MIEGILKQKATENLEDVSKLRAQVRVLLERGDNLCAEPKTEKGKKLWGILSHDSLSRSSHTLNLLVAAALSVAILTDGLSSSKNVSEQKPTSIEQIIEENIITPDEKGWGTTMTNGARIEEKGAAGKNFIFFRHFVNAISADAELKSLYYGLDMPTQRYITKAFASAIKEFGFDIKNASTVHWAVMNFRVINKVFSEKNFPNLSAREVDSIHSKYMEAIGAQEA